VINVVLGLVIAVLSGLFVDEVRGCLELIPRAILRLVAMRLPADQRQAIYNEEWRPELIFKLRKAEGRPISRLISGTWYAVSMSRAAGRVARELDGVREELETPASLSDVGGAVDDLDVYRDSYAPLHPTPGEFIPGGHPGGLVVTAKGIEFSAEGFVMTGSGRLGLGERELRDEAKLEAQNISRLTHGEG